MKDRLLIIGAGGHGKVAADIAMKMQMWQKIEFLDDDESVDCCIGLKVVGRSFEAFSLIAEADFFIAIGNNSTREKIQSNLQTIGASVITLIHPNAVIGSEVKIGTGSVVMAGVVINSSTVIGKGCIINTGSCLDHDNVVGDYVHISPGVITAGNVNIGCGTWLGTGSIVINNISICSDCIIGAGGVVIKNVTEAGTYVGIPVRQVIISKS